MARGLATVSVLVLLPMLGCGDAGDDKSSAMPAAAPASHGAIVARHHRSAEAAIRGFNRSVAHLNRSQDCGRHLTGAEAARERLLREIRWLERHRSWLPRGLVAKLARTERATTGAGAILAKAEAVCDISSGELQKP